MIVIAVIAAALLLVWFGGPLLVDPVRRAFRRREEARQRHEAEQEEIRQAQLAAQQERERLWREEPDRAGLPEWLNFGHAVQLPLQHVSDEAGRLHAQREEHVRQRQSEHRDGKPVTAAYKVIVLAGLAAFVFAGLLGIALDYLIFRGLHPAGTVVLPLALACLAVLGITVGSVVFMSAWRHGLLASSTIPYVRRVVTLGGVILAAGIALYVTMIAPYRSAPAGEANIKKAQEVLRQDQTARPPNPAWLIAQDRQQVVKARADLAHAQLVDRLSAAALAFMEIPLSEAAVLGSGLLALELAKLRREQARRAKQHADDNLEHANARFSAALAQILVAHGHGEEVFARIQARLARLAASGSTAPPGTGPAPSPNGSQRHPPPPAAGNATPALPGQTTPGNAATPGPPAAPGGHAAPAGPGRPASATGLGQGPTITVISPGGSGYAGSSAPPHAGSQAPVNGNPPAATASPAELSPTEFDETA